MHHSCSVQLGCQAWCSKDACTVQRFRYMQHEPLCCPACLLYVCMQHEPLCCPACLLYAYMNALLCTPGVGNTHTYIHTHVTANQVPALYVLSVYVICNSRSCSRSIHTSHNDLSLRASYQSYVRASLHSTVLNKV